MKYSSLVVLSLLFIPVLSLSALAHAEISPLPIIVNPPSSSGVNQGFSRSPSDPFYDRERNILVIEGIRATEYQSPKGNNTCFDIIEYYIDPQGKELKKTSWCVFEGTDKLSNEETFSYKNIAPYTFRDELGDGEYCIYTVRFTKEGEFQRLEATYFDKEGRFKQAETRHVDMDGTIRRDDYPYPKPCRKLFDTISPLGNVRDGLRGDHLDLYDGPWGNGEEITLYDGLWGNGEEIKTDNPVHFFLAAVSNLPCDDWTCSGDGTIIAFVENLNSGCNSVRFYVYKREGNMYKKVGIYNFVCRLLCVQENKTVLTHEGIFVTAAYSDKGGKGKVREMSVNLFFSFSKPESTFDGFTDRQQFHEMTSE